jgi:hypothetical protein
MSFADIIISLHFPFRKLKSWDHVILKNFSTMLEGELHLRDRLIEHFGDDLFILYKDIFCVISAVREK